MGLTADIGRRIREIRVVRALSQDGLAEQLGVAAKTVSRWERGEQEFKTERLEEIADALNVNVLDLLPDREKSAPDATQKNSGKDADIRAVIGIWVAHMQVTLRDVADSVNVLRENVDVLRDILEGVRDHLTIMEDRFKIEGAPQIPEIEQLQEMFDSLRSRREQRRAAKMTDAERTRSVAYGERPRPASAGEPDETAAGRQG